MPPSESTMPLCDLLAQVRSYWRGEERRVEEECEKQGLESALLGRDLRSVPRWLLLIHRRDIIGWHELSSLHPQTHALLLFQVIEAKKKYEEEQFERSGKSPTDFFGTPNVWDFCCQELIKDLPEPLTEDELDDYLARVTLRAIESSCRASVELARLHQQGFTTKLLARILTEYPNDTKAMDLPRPTTRDTAGTAETGMGVLTGDEGSEPSETHTGQDQPASVDNRVYLSASGWKILKALYEVRGTSEPMDRRGLAMAAGLSERTVTKHASALREKAFVQTPKDLGKGYLITKDGDEAYRSHSGA